MMLDVLMSLGFDLSLNVRCPLMKPAFDMAGVVSEKKKVVAGGCSDGAASVGVRIQADLVYPPPRQPRKLSE
jgi:hypothetical protein